MTKGRKLKLSDKDWNRAAAAWGAEAEARTRANPYDLMSLRIPFRIADTVAMDLGVSKADPRRTIALAIDLLELSLRRDGHTCMHKHTLLYESGATEAQLRADERFIFEDKRVFLITAHAAETHLAQWIAERVER